MGDRQRHLPARDRFAVLVQGARRDVATLEAMWPLVVEHARRRPGTFGETVEDGDRRAALEALAALGRLHSATEQVCRRLPELSKRVLATTCALCPRRGRLREGLCDPCYSSWRTWRLRHPAGTRAAWSNWRRDNLAGEEVSK